MRIEQKPLGTPWVTRDPFLFCMHHRDHYPKGNSQLGPNAALTGRHMGQDFSGRDGWSMYHGTQVPGFPPHPHRGFETITLARAGFIDHADSTGAAARFGKGDVQWMTAGKGIVHSEMFPLLRDDADNPTELFQIWLNLPQKNKFVDPHFSMLWAETVPRFTSSDTAGAKSHGTLIAGSLGEYHAPPPPPNSWASAPESHVLILSLRLEPGASFELPRAPNADVLRTLYFFNGDELALIGSENEQTIGSHSALEVNDPDALGLRAGASGCELLLLQGRPIGEPVAHYGPFVMNTREELQEAFTEYQTTQFGGWPWPTGEPVHPKEAGRFARHSDGTREDRSRFSQ